MNPLLGVAAVTSLMVYALTQKGPGNLVECTSTLDGRSYRVQDLPDKQDAANRLSQVRTGLDKILHEYRQPEYFHDEPTQLLVQRLKIDHLMENDIASQYTSYSENKGERIVLCLRDKTAEPYPLIDINTIMFVTLHEMAHLMTVSSGHTQEFWTNFRRLLQDAMKAGVYTQVNYSRSPVEYCGMMITDSPL
jgi:predicted metal-dependent hydrolase